MKKISIIAFGIIISIGILQSCQTSTAPVSSSTDNVDSLKKIILELAASTGTI
jgi:hypothetical protein